MSSNRIVIGISIATGASTVALSMTLNVWGFCANHPGLFGTVVGVLLPLWVLALTFIGHKAMHTDKRLGVAAYGLAGFLLVVSIPHLAHGFDLITGGCWWESWSLAIVTDLCQVICKVVVITSTSGHKVSVKTTTKRTSKKQTLKVAV